MTTDKHVDPAVAPKIIEQENQVVDTDIPEGALRFNLTAEEIQEAMIESSTEVSHLPTFTWNSTCVFAKQEKQSEVHLLALCTWPDTAYQYHIHLPGNDYLSFNIVLSVLPPFSAIPYSGK